ncbi:MULTISPECIES: 4'-phosphopantetheinyl transferase [unclassified Pseudomonas]|uniref:4'-phosphopantetheinyl transferase family protein n=1 Tax=unclassified Pseudomonas TaxID=196821 RepID=UPI000BC8BE07|nr:MULTISPECIES: 4'-phosphopantetheinyl transferase superfamily protein [unclassified Pseudomonas]PVZ16406.1 enterobactin synthetase component D [Pseudomonas sp. URIL14HWK12:I12]PVZ25738.1 enterobactin synthetase component D [Pseudomonas sp. URIL14HWK12:I10]PVZ36738.1 enterobactin synthetase component D [Pseudomonas sp. URIL14HWK12:I11]SNZ12712.1 enterobactin synthetase component D [Pseudomonas sp. URIL14HWK12:I9]
MLHTLGPLSSAWPLPNPASGAVLTCCSFSAQALRPDDFQRHAVQPPENIQRSVAKRQAEFLAGRVCAREAVRAVSGLGWVAPVGKDRAPLWPAGVRASITHSDQWAACVAARSADWQALGLDAETLLAPERAQRLKSEILTPTELERLPADETLAALAVTLTFSLKESLFKALYPLVLQRFWFEHAELLGWSSDGQARLRLLTDLSERWRHGVEIDAQFCIENRRLLSLVAIAPS